MLPFGETVLAWRLARGMTQAALARAAGVPRPNLSAIERGDREITLKTLRALALALDVRPGILADGVAPASGLPVLGRPALERVARAAALGSVLRDQREAGVARLLRAASRLSRAKPTPGPKGSGDRAYFLLRMAVASQAPSTLASLVDRLAGARKVGRR